MMITLIDEMKDALPLYAYPTKQLIEALPDRHLSRKARLEIDDVFFAGNEGGIVCALKFPDQTVAVISATHLVFSDQQPIYAKINNYNRERIQALKAEHNALSRQSVGSGGKNLPCPCGSGKKYKNCCGK